MNLFYSSLHMIGVPLLKFLFHLEIKGKENIPLKGGVVFASNHASYLDPIIVGAASPRQLHFLAVEKLFDVKFVSWVIRKLNAIPVSREKTELKTIKRVIDILRKGEALLLFPEGTRNPKDTMLAGKRGIGLITQVANVPIIPVFIKGSGKALPRDKKWISPHKVWIIFGKPFYPQKLNVEGKKKEFYQEISHKVMNEIKKLKPKIS